MGLETLRPQRASQHCRGCHRPQACGASLASARRKPSGHRGAEQKPGAQVAEARGPPWQEPQSPNGPARQSQGMYPATPGENPLPRLNVTNRFDGGAAPKPLPLAAAVARGERLRASLGALRACVPKCPISPKNLKLELGLPSAGKTPIKISKKKLE